MQKDHVTESSRKVLAEFCLILNGPPTLIDRTWTVSYVRYGKLSNAFVDNDEQSGFEAALRTRLHSEDIVYSDDALLDMLDTVVRQAELLITMLGGNPDPIRFRSPDYGTPRYKAVGYAHDVLTGIDNKLRDRAEWEKAQPRSGCEIVRLLIALKELLQKMGEGAPQPVS
jgi:hypothetical protein